MMSFLFLDKSALTQGKKISLLIHFSTIERKDSKRKKYKRKKKVG